MPSDRRQTTWRAAGGNARPPLVPTHTGQTATGEEGEEEAGRTSAKGKRNKPERKRSRRHRRSGNESGTDPSQKHLRQETVRIRGHPHGGVVQGHGHVRGREVPHQREGVVGEVVGEVDLPDPLHRQGVEIGVIVIGLTSPEEASALLEEEEPQGPDSVRARFSPPQLRVWTRVIRVTRC